ncbi:UDP-N-acetylmuramoyl-tripeptide--D-alanyl-D-alanine ligase [Clostridium cylindrosporum]|uniref:UDP-N-acetylmuramoyl-tripeptide--D-alanyl-D-alanine ligase n=1 Tax=Clostridium cylindrosporum DSM 605 TaxID=1121307 RepID=A0A0J8DAS5_CLOCY|nr:UDP-N-acetylmuramoyl-tripeptide--D-alanyl-D-alanine ligase [Clostridium cylindrosporum]KMT21403.1 UDP-N-acetylmuramoyl-tripeptide--D-alanyl-D-alanine ligase MurF [Clostridium cylindrosporum DSM 605]
MEKMTLDEIINILDGNVVNYKENIVVNGVSTDTRTINEGDLFVALKGENFNGNKFVSKAVENGAICAIVSEPVESDIPYILVNNTLFALGKIAAYYKSKFNIPFIAVTGSVGKTSTKEVISSVLSKNFNVHKTDKNFNNEIGLPHTLFNLKHGHEVSVLEMGMNNFHEIERLSEIAKPNIGVITNIGTAHIENLGSKEGILKAKMEITTFFDKDSILIVNGDDELLKTVGDMHYKIIKLSINNLGDYNAFDVIDYGEEGIEFKIIYKGSEETIKVNSPGVYNVYNALAAIAIADILGMRIEDMKEGIADFAPCGMRMNVKTLKDGIKIIADCYNANPESMKASLSVLNSFKGNKKIAVLGDMFELGDYSETGHREVGIDIRNKANVLIAIGENSKYIYDEAKDYIESRYFLKKEEAQIYLRNILEPGDIALVKASRGMKLETVIDYITKDTERGN